MSVFVYRFEDCMNACASFNAESQYSNHEDVNCAGVSCIDGAPHELKNNMYNDGNYFLKAAALAAHTNSSVSSAM